MSGRLNAIFMAAMLAGLGTANAQSNFDKIYAFGDSYADLGSAPGGIFRLSGVPFPPGYPLGRFSNGENFVDRLQDNFGITNPNAVNFAFGGALTNGSNIGNAAGPGLLTEIGLVNLGNVTFGPKDIIALSVGGNNALAVIAGNLSPAAATFFGTQSATDVGVAMQALVDRGARTITYFSLGGNLYPTDPTRTQAQTDAALAFGNAFLPAVQKQFATIAAEGIRVNYFNFGELQQRIFTGGEAGRFGFNKETNVPPSVFDVPCLNVAPGTCTPVKDPAGHFYWDAVHLTEAGYNLAADFMTIQLAENETIPVAADLANIQARNFADTLSQRMEARRYGAVPYEGGYSMKDDTDPKRLSWKDTPAPQHDDRFALFVAGGYAAGQRDDRPGEVGFDFNLANIVAGAEWKPYEHTLLGAAVGYTKSNADFDFLRGSGETDLSSVNFGVYASLSYPNFFADLTLAYATNDYDLSRTGIVSPNGFPVALDTSADADGHSFVADFRTGYLFHSGAFGIGPVGGLTYARVTVDGYTESGDSLLTMNVDKQELESLTGSIGVQLRYKGDGFEPYVAVTLEKEFMGDRSYEFALTSAPDVINTVDVGEESDPFGRVRAGLKAHLSDGLTGTIDGNATFGREFGDDYAVSGSLTYRF